MPVRKVTTHNIPSIYFVYDVEVFISLNCTESNEEYIKKNINIIREIDRIKKCLR